MGYARIAIGHVGGGLLRMCDHPADAKLLQVHHRLAQNRVHIEDMRDAVALECLGDKSGAGDGVIGSHEADPHSAIAPERRSRSQTAESAKSAKVLNLPQVKHLAHVGCWVE